MSNLIPLEISNQIVDMIRGEKGGDAEIKVVNNPTYCVIKFLGIHSLRVKCGKTNYIALKNSYQHIWTNNEFIKAERIKSDELWSRVTFNSIEELKSLYPLFLQLYDEAFSLVNVELFSCCSMFTQCSDAKACIQPNKRMSVGCQYKKNLESGRIFYGINRNIELNLSTPQQNDNPMHDTFLLPN